MGDYNAFLSRLGRTTDPNTGRPRSRVQGVPAAQPYSGLDSFYALQDRRIPAFSGGRSKIPSAGEFAQQAYGMGAQINSDGKLAPYGQNASNKGGIPAAGAPDDNILYQAARENSGNPETPALNGMAPPPVFSSAPIGPRPSEFSPESTTGDFARNMRKDMGYNENAIMSDPIAERRAILEQQTAARKMAQAALNPSPVQFGSNGTGVLNSKYGTGSVTQRDPRAPSQFTVNSGAPGIPGQSGKDWFQDAATRQQSSNKFATPENRGSDYEKWRKAFANSV